MRYGLGRLECAAYSTNPTNPNVPLIATGGGIGAVIWNAETGEQVRILSAPRHYVRSVSFSPDGTKVLAGSGGWDNVSQSWYGGAELWDTSTGTFIRTFSGHSWAVASVAFSPDGTNVLAGSYDNTAKLWDASTGAEICTFSGHTGIVHSVAFSLDGTKVLTGSADWTAKLWDASTGAEICTFSGHTGIVQSVAFSPDGTKVLTGSADYSAKLWDASTGAEICTFSGHTGTVRSVAFSPDGTKILTGSADYTAKLWAASTRAEIRSFAGHTGGVCSVAFSPDEAKVLTGSYDNTAKLWAASTGALIRTFSGHTDSIWSVAVSPDGTKVLMGSQDQTANLWKASTGSEIRTFEHTDAVHSVAFSTDGTKVLTGSWDMTAKLWNASTGTQIRTFSGHTGRVSGVAFSPDGTKLLTGSEDYTAKLWDASTGSEIHTFSGHSGSVKSVAFSPDGTKVLTGSYDRTAKLWNALTGAQIRTFSGHAGEVSSVAFSPDGMKVLTGAGFPADKTAKLWYASTGAKIRTFSGHAHYVESVAFSPDGTKVLTGSYDSTAKLWNASTGAEIQTFFGHTDGVYSVAFSPDGKKILTGGYDGLTLLWSISSREEDKILLVAGGGAYAGNPIAAQTKALAELAHVTATVRGYSPENIRYLSAFETPAQNPRVDGAASADAITSAVLDWASGARRLTIMLIDHGEYDPGIPEWYFLVDGTRSPRNFLTASALDAALNTAQSGGDPLPELCVYVDMCYAGGFVSKLSAAPAGMQRIVIASTASDRLANFGGGDSGSLSFSGFFLSSALLGRTLGDCFEAARTTIVALNLPSTAPQTPWLDDDADRQFTKSDGAVAGRHVFGSHPASGLLPPEITAARATGRLDAPADYQVWLELGPGPVKRAQAVVSSTADDYPSSAPITNVRTYTLSREAATQRWSGTVPAADLRNHTRYTIVYIAHHDDGFGLEIASDPWTSLLGVSIRAEVPRERWELYDKRIGTSLLSLNDPVGFHWPPAPLRRSPRPAAASARSVRTSSILAGPAPIVNSARQG